MTSKCASELLEKIDQGDGALVALETMEYEDLMSNVRRGPQRNLSTCPDSF